MFRFADITADHTSSAYYHVLCVGGGPEQETALRNEVERFAEVRASRWVASPEEAEPLLAGRELHVGQWEGCLLVFWLLDTTEFDAGLRSLPSSLGSSQAVGFAVTRTDPALSWRNLIELIGRDFALIGPRETCLEAIRTWCGSPVPGKRSGELSLPFRKRPSRWIRDLKHDYIVNVALAQPFRSILETHGLWELQREIDLLQNVLSNLLCFPWSENMEHGIPFAELSEACLLYRKVYPDAKCRIVAPRTLASVLERYYTVGEELVLYSDEGAVAGELEAAARDACAPILLRTPESGLAADWESAAAPFRVPTVLVSPTPHRTIPSSWRALLSNNVVGSYTFTELEESPRRPTVVTSKRSSWRLCAHLTLAEVFDRLVDGLLATYEGLGEAGENVDLREQVFRGLAMAWSAKKLYCDETINDIRV